MAFADPELRRLEWRCRRGMKELDLVLLRYLQGRLAHERDAERAAFAQFLELPDPVMARYLLAGELPEDARLAAVCRALREA
jgi:antitoxin CptB